MWLEIVTGPQPTSEVKVMCPLQSHLSFCFSRPSGDSAAHSKGLSLLSSSAKNGASRKAQLLSQTIPFHHHEFWFLPGLQRQSDSDNRERIGSPAALQRAEVQESESDQRERGTQFLLMQPELQCIPMYSPVENHHREGPPKRWNGESRGQVSQRL